MLAITNNVLILTTERLQPAARLLTDNAASIFLIERGITMKTVITPREVAPASEPVPFSKQLEKDAGSPGRARGRQPGVTP